LSDVEAEKSRQLVEGVRHAGDTASKHVSQHTVGGGMTMR
jgi:hypothetical protein